MGQYWCHLLEACVCTTNPCSPYDSAAEGRGFALPPRYPAIPPFYHLVADLPLRLNPGSELKTISVSWLFSHVIGFSYSHYGPMMFEYVFSVTGASSRSSNHGVP